jgi:hypothetical protein
MLTSDSTGIQKYILDRLTQIDDEIINDDPRYRELMENEALMEEMMFSYWVAVVGRGVEKIVV